MKAWQKVGVHVCDQYICALLRDEGDQERRFQPDE
jgi:hypothetical protein